MGKNKQKTWVSRSAGQSFLALACMLVQFGLFPASNACSQEAVVEARLAGYDADLAQYLDSLKLRRLKVSFWLAELEKSEQADSADSADAQRIARQVLLAAVEELQHEIPAAEFETDEQVGAKARRSELLLLITHLTSRYPKLDHPEIQVAVIASEFELLQSQFSALLIDPVRKKILAHSTGLTPAVGSWAEFLERCKDLEQQVVSQLASLGELDADARNQSTDLLAVKSQLDFVAGWIRYYLAIGNPIESERGMREQWVSASRQSFFNLLGVNSLDELLAMQAEDIGLEVPWIARSVLGLALVDLVAADGQPQSGQALFRLLETQDVDRSISSSLPWWKLQGLCLAKDWEAANGLIVGWLSDEHHLRSDLCLAIMAHVCQQQASGPAGSAMIELALLKRCAAQGLMRSGNFEVLQQLEREGTLDFRTDSFVGLWFAAWKRFDAHQQSTEQAAEIDRAELTRAADELRLALGFREDWIAKLDLAQCRYLLAWVLLELGQFEQAAAHWRAVSSEMRSVDDKLSSKSLWLQTMAWKRIPGQPAGSPRLKSAMQELVRLYPSSEYAGRATLELARLQIEAGEMNAARRSLQVYRVGDEFYPHAQLELLRIAVREIQVSRTTRERQLAQFDRLEQQVQEFLKRGLPREQQLGAINLWVLALLGCEGYPQKLTKIQHWLDRGGPLFEELAAVDDGLACVSNFRFARYRWANLALADLQVPAQGVSEFDTGQGERGNENSEWENQLGNARAAQELLRIAQADSDWLASESNPDSASRAQVLVGKLRQLERQLDNTAASENQRNEILDRAYSCAGQLSHLLGDSSQDLASNVNARVVYYRLAELELELEEFDKARLRLVELTRLYPRKFVYWRKLAEASSLAQRWEEALPLWEKVVAAEEVGSSGWLEAKCRIADIVLQIPTGGQAGLDQAELDRVEAQGKERKKQMLAVIRQALLLSPQADSRWRAKAKALCEQLEQVD